jgi:hypothetical protein
MIRFACPTCRKVLKIADHCAGGKVACPRCGQRLQIPAAPAPPVRVRDRTILGESLPASPAPPPSPTPGAKPPATAHGDHRSQPPPVRVPSPPTPAPQTEQAPDWLPDVVGEEKPAPPPTEQAAAEAPSKAKGIPDWAWYVIVPALLLVVIVGGMAFMSDIGLGPPGWNMPPGDMPLKAFILQKPAGPIAVQADMGCELSTHYSDAFRHCEETHFSFRIASDSPSYASAYVYAPKTSEHGRRLYELLKDGSKRRLTLRIQRVGPDGEALPAIDDSNFALIGIVE